MAAVVQHRAVRLGVAAVLPVVWALALVPLRHELSESVSLLMVVPVLVVAMAGGVGPGALAALAAASAFAVLHTEPYGLPRIDRADDVLESLVLLGLGLVIGLLADAARTFRHDALTRRTELAALGSLVRAISEGSAQEVVACARDGIAGVLDADRVDWHDGPATDTLPALGADGATTGELPSVLRVDASPAGHFVVTAPRPDASPEHRRTASLVATATARWLTGATGR